MENPRRAFSKSRWMFFFPGKDQYEFDKLYDQFVQCGEDWLKSDLVISTTSTREHARTGSWKTMSKAAALLTCTYILNLLFIPCNISHGIFMFMRLRIWWQSTTMPLWLMISWRARPKQGCGCPTQIFQTTRTHHVAYCLASSFHGNIHSYKSIISIPQMDWQDLREYWCWSMMEEKDTNLRANSISTTSTGHLDQATAKALMSHPQFCSI